jgi:hypothetical protein
MYAEPIPRKLGGIDMKDFQLLMGCGTIDPADPSLTVLGLVATENPCEADILFLELSPRTAAAHFLAEIGSIDRFERYQNLIAFWSTDPGIYQSGAITKRGRITKHGNASLRKYLYLMGMGLIRSNPYFKAFYEKKRDEGFPHRKAMVALMNKLIKTLFAMLKKKEKFIVQS